MGNSGFSVDLGISNTSDTLNPIYAGLHNIPGVGLLHQSDSLLKVNLQSGAITAVVDIQKSTNPQYIVRLKSFETVKPQDIAVVKALVNAVISNADTTKRFATIQPDVQKIPGREFREIDRILPGMLGFSLLGTGVFSVAFLFFNLRSQLVLKRFFATPILRSSIIVGEGLSRIIFQLLSVILIIIFGFVFFNFTLVNGVATFLDMMLLCFLAAVIFMGIGFIVSSVARTESVIPVFSNIFVFPQFLLSGTFFSITVFPKWMQVICNALPLTRFNHAMRSISYDGASLLSTWPDIAVLLVYGVVIYAIAIKVFKWE